MTPQTPPTFLWHTADDAVVPVENSLMFAEALSENKVPFELHIYPHGPHGMETAERISGGPVDKGLWYLVKAAGFLMD